MTINKNIEYLTTSKSLKRMLKISCQVCSVALLLILTGGTAQAQPLMKLANEKPYGSVRFDILEAAPTVDGVPIQWDMIGTIGKQYNRFWIRSDGNVLTSQRAGEVELQALYSRLIAPYWEFQAGVRYDVGYAGSASDTRGHLVVALTGMAPYWFELEPALFVSQDGDVSASLTASYDLFVTQRLLLQPRLDLLAAVQEVSSWGMGSGLNSVGLGVRLRYEIRREFAPYVGFEWTRLSGKTADLARQEGESAGAVSLVAGLRWWR